MKFFVFRPVFFSLQYYFNWSNLKLFLKVLKVQSEPFNERKPHIQPEKLQIGNATELYRGRYKVIAKYGARALDDRYQ